MITRSEILQWLEHLPAEKYRNMNVRLRFLDNKRAFHGMIGRSAVVKWDGALITHAFPWHTTREGADFWLKVDREYRDWYRNRMKDEKRMRMPRGKKCEKYEKTKEE